MGPTAHTEEANGTRDTVRTAQHHHHNGSPISGQRDPWSAIQIPESIRSSHRSEPVTPTSRNAPESMARQ